MTTAIQRHSGALPSVEKAKALLAQARSTHEVRKIRAIAQAVATVERGKEIAIDASEIVLFADARIGELRREVAGDARRNSTNGRIDKSSFDKEAKLSNRAGSEAERLADLSARGELKKYADAERKAGRPMSTTSAVALARLPSDARSSVIAKLGDLPDFRAAMNSVRREQRVEHIAEISKGNSPLTGALGRFPVLYVDPPWPYEHVKTTSRAIENQYPTMPLEDIRALAVKDIATPDAILFCWATSPKLAEALQIVDDWGFSYRTNMVWEKDKIGMGYYARQMHELLLICTIGQPPVPPEDARPPSVIKAPRGEHSEKPPIFYELIERMYPAFKKIELFSRAPREGWSAWGNES